MQLELEFALCYLNKNTHTQHMASHDVIRESETELHCVCLRTWRVATSRPLPNIVQRVGIIARSCFIIAPAIGCHFYGWF